MLSEREVISTLNMLRNEHLDVRTVTLGVSLFDCVSHDLELFTANVKAKINRYASQLVRVCNEVGDKYGIPVVNKRISVSPIAVVGAPFGPDGMVRVCKALDDAAKEAGVDFLGGFSALVETGFANGDRVLHDWWAKACNGRAPRRRSVRVTLLAPDHERAVKRWRFRNARPTSLHYSPLDAMGNALVMESLAVAFDSVEIE